ncbi:MAG: BlaI/MecI/CopY family transcriptional regulator [Flavobacteriaceae bacterium]|nr:BlaI/MecI/CopY family transcriptional regulator [Flavobacteriaceae bacterium]
MKNLSTAEEQLMRYLWKLKKAFMKDLLEQYPEPKPATTTLATLIKRMIAKEFVAYHQIGKAREYYPLVSQKNYSSRKLKGFMKHYFRDSPSELLSFFTEEEALSQEELKDLQQLINEKLKNKK